MSALLVREISTRRDYWRNIAITLIDPLTRKAIGSSSPSPAPSSLAKADSVGAMNKDQPNAARAFSFHFGTFTPFTMSHRQSDNSPIKASTRMRKIVPAYAGARMSVKLLTR